MNRLFTEAESAEIVIERLAGCDDPGSARSWRPPSGTCTPS